MTTGIGHWLAKREFLTPDKEAIVDGDHRYTYRQLNRRVNRLCHVLQKSGLSGNDRIGILSYNCTEFVEVIMATAKLGFMLVPLNWRLTAKELAYNIEDSGLRMLLFDTELEQLAKDVMVLTSLKQSIAIGSNSSSDFLSYDALLETHSDNEPKINNPVGLQTPHIIMYTAGTTGKPKGAVLSQGASFWNAMNLGLALDFSSSDRNLAVLPMFHIGGIGLFTLPMIYFGGSVVIERSFDSAQTIELLESERITLFFGVAAVFLFLIQHPEFNPKVFETVRVVMSGGSPLPVSLVTQYKDAGIFLQQGFGMSEAGPGIATLDKQLAIAKAGSIGRALFHVDARIVDERMNDLPAGSVGELIVKGPNLLDEYWNRPEATKESFSGDWFHTGDLARMDDEGDLYIVDRKKDMFISGGENVYPAEVENSIYELPQVAEAAVIGVPDDKWGEVGVAVISLKKGQALVEAEIKTHLENALAKYKVPKKVVFVEQLPRNAAGKVLKNELRMLYEP